MLLEVFNWTIFGIDDPAIGGLVFVLAVGGPILLLICGLPWKRSTRARSGGKGHG